ncbi:MAG TPA: response regulator [Sulfurospirillum sp. UBA11407]|nr:MAG TPA: response regulator [Sulfurospirillum sp. UBA11407]
MASKSIKVVIIDDEKEILDMIEKYLRRDVKYVVQTYQNPLLALNAIDNSVDVILLDIMMPQMNGLDVLSELIKKNIKAKIIMMTAYSTLDKVLKSHREGATNYVMKPFESLKSLEEKILEVL